MESKLTAPLNKIIRFSNVDGPGNRMTIFFQGCNFNCLYCHNPETINMCNNCGKCLEVCPTHSLSKNSAGKIVWNRESCINCDLCFKSCKRDASPKIEEVEISDLIEEVKKVRFFIKGITVSGGECTLRYKFLTEFFRQVKQLYPELTCFVDTNGSVDLSQKEYEEFVKVTDFFMLDIKGWTKEEHFQMVNFENINPLKNLKYLKEIEKLYEVRSVIVPNLLDNENIVKNVSKIITKTNIRYKIIKYRAIGVREKNRDKLISPTDDYLEKLKEIAKSFEVNAIIT